METRTKKKRRPLVAVVGDWVEQQDLSVDSRLIAVWAVGRMNDDGRFGTDGTKAMGAKWLGDKLGMGEDRAWRGLKELCKAHVFEKVCKVKVEHGWANCYRVIDPALLALRTSAYDEPVTVRTGAEGGDVDAPTVRTGADGEPSTFRTGADITSSPRTLPVSTPLDVPDFTSVQSGTSTGFDFARSARSAHPVDVVDGVDVDASHPSKTYPAASLGGVDAPAAASGGPVGVGTPAPKEQRAHTPPEAMP